MEVWKIKLFIHVCVLCAAAECLQLKEDDLICLVEECLAMALVLEDGITQNICYILLGTLYEKIQQIRKAYEYHKKHLHTAQQLGDRNGEFAAYENLGIANYLLGNFHEATKYHEKCLELAKAMGYKKGVGAAYANLGNDYWSLGKYHKAIEYHERCLSIAVELGDKRTEGTTYSHLGNVYQTLGEYQTAIEYQEKLLGIAFELSDRALEAGGYGNLGNIFQLLENYQKAIEYHNKSLGIALSIGDKRGQGAAYGNIGNAYQSLGKYQEAKTYHEQCLSIAVEIEDRQAEGNTHGNLGVIYHSQGKYQEAIEYHEKRLRIAIEIGDRKGEGDACANIGSAYQSLEKCLIANEYYDKCLSIAVEIADKRLERKANENLGSTHLSLSKYAEALEYNQKALEIAMELGDKKGEEKACGNLGSTYRLQGKYLMAVKYLERRLSIAVDIGDKEGEGSAYGNLGRVCFLMGSYQKALEYYRKSLAISVEINSKSVEELAYANLGDYYQAFGKFHEAKQCYEKRLSIAKAIGHRAGEGEAYVSIGMIHWLLGEYQEAIEYHKRSLAVAVEIGDRNGEGTAYWSLGNVYHSLGKYYEAIECQEKCLGIAKEIGDRKKQGAAYGGIGNAYHSLEQYQKAIEYCKKHLSIAEKIDDRDGQGQAHFNIGGSYGSLALQEDSDKPTNMKEAERHYKKCIQCFESLFDDLEQDQYKILIVDTFIAAYKRLTLIYLEIEQTEEALLISDRGRARALGDILTSKYGMRKSVTSKSHPIEVTDIETILSTCNFSILFSALQRKDVAVHIWVLAPQSPLYFHYSEIKGSSIKHSSQDISVEGDKKSIFNLVIKSYDKIKVREGGVKCEDRSLEFLEVEDQDIGKQPVADENTTEGRKFGTEVNGTDTARSAYDEEEDERPLQLLYDVLVAPVQHKLVQEEIVIIPDGPLYMVPYAAFQDPKTGQFLSETKRIRLAPSLTTLKVIHETPSDQYVKSSALIVGNPEIGKVNFEGSKRSFTNLPGAEIEATEIAKLLGVEPLIGKQATKEAVVHKLQVGVSVIHFAAHGSQENGQILLAPSASSATSSMPHEQDYILTMKEAQESGIRAQLVVLSCCHSGRGEIKAEGVVGMSRAFLAAGARAVVASLWAIDDDATKVFMLKFYSHLKRGESASRSLQQAMQDMRETTRYKEPRYWAAFFLIGDDVTISV